MAPTAGHFSIAPLCRYRGSLGGRLVFVWFTLFSFDQFVCVFNL